MASQPQEGMGFDAAGWSVARGEAKVPLHQVELDQADGEGAGNSGYGSAISVDEQAASPRQNRTDTTLGPHVGTMRELVLAPRFRAGVG
jgi:hypothetical protein